MSRYIDADELIFFGLDNPDDEHLFEFVPKEFIDNAPTADVVERKHGEWIEAYEDYRQQISWWECSVCKYGISWKPNYCPECGARMDERREDE